MSVMETTPVSAVDGVASSTSEPAELCRTRGDGKTGRHIRPIYLTGVLLVWQQALRAFRWMFDCGQPNILFRSDRPDLTSARIHRPRLPTRMKRRVDKHR